MAALLRLFLLVVAAIAAAVLMDNFRKPPATEPAAPIQIRNIELPIVAERRVPAPVPPPPPRPRAVPPPPLPPPPPSPPPVPPPQPQLSDQELYARYAGAIIQILCATREELFAASGVVVNSGGLVLTNAHVAEILKKSGESNCQARHKNPAEPFAKIEIVFIPDTTAKIAETGVPQRDFAFLRLVEARSPFLAAAPAAGIAERGTTLLTLGYPSEFLEGIATSANSNLVFSALAVNGYADVDGDLSTAEAYVFKGGIVLQRGSSGTALFERSGKMVGLIFATTKGATTAEREGLALTMPYINRVLLEETKQSLPEFIASH